MFSRAPPLDSLNPFFPFFSLFFDDDFSLVSRRLRPPIKKKETEANIGKNIPTYIYRKRYRYSAQRNIFVFLMNNI